MGSLFSFQQWFISEHQPNPWTWSALTAPQSLQQFVCFLCAGVTEDLIVLFNPYSLQCIRVSFVCTLQYHRSNPPEPDIFWKLLSVLSVTDAPFLHFLSNLESQLSMETLKTHQNFIFNNLPFHLWPLFNSWRFVSDLFGISSPSH